VKRNEFHEVLNFKHVFNVHANDLVLVRAAVAVLITGIRVDSEVFGFDCLTTS
jgi:hypothetical protein